MKKTAFRFLKNAFHNITDRRRAVFIKKCRILNISRPKILSLGVGDGSFTKMCVDSLLPEKIVGIELDDENIKSAQSRGIEVIKSDLNMPFPIEDSSFDIVISDQVIEHLVDPDNFVKETHRVLKKNGIAVIGTENLASWHNIFALICGQQAFTQHVSSYKHVGNIFSLYRKCSMEGCLKHQQIFTCRGLKEIFEIHGFHIKNLFGVGYLPFPSFIQKILEKIDPYHSFFMGIICKKNN